MNEELKQELTDVLTAYLADWKTLLDCYMWLASVDWDDPTLDPNCQEVLGLFELLSTEVLEGFRDEIEFAQEASDFVASATGSRYAVQELRATVSTFASSSDSNVRSLMPMVEAQGELSWNISPLTVSV